MPPQDRVKRWLHQSGRKQNWLAKELGCTEVTVSNWLNGKSVPHPIFCARITEISWLAVGDREEWKKGLKDKNNGK